MGRRVGDHRGFVPTPSFRAAFLVVALHLATNHRQRLLDLRAARTTRLDVVGAQCNLPTLHAGFCRRSLDRGHDPGATLPPHLVGFEHDAGLLGRPGSRMEYLLSPHLTRLDPFGTFSRLPAPGDGPAERVLLHPSRRLQPSHAGQLPVWSSVGILRGNGAGVCHWCSGFPRREVKGQGGASRDQSVSDGGERASAVGVSRAGRGYPVSGDVSLAGADHPSRPASCQPRSLHPVLRTDGNRPGRGRAAVSAVLADLLF